jgi:hypothetical protein
VVRYHTIMFGRMCGQSGFEYQRHPFSNIYFFTFCYTKYGHIQIQLQK